MSGLFFYYVFLPLAIVGINLWFKHLDHKSKVEIEEAKIKAAMRLRSMQEDERRQQHERQITELRAVAQDKLKKTNPPAPVDSKVEPTVAPAAFEAASMHKVAPTLTHTPDVEELAEAGVYVSDDDEQPHF